MMPARLTRRLSLFTLALIVLPAHHLNADDAPAAHAPFSYPPVRKCDQVDIYHGVEVADPYRWLEDPDSAETQTWVAAQNRLARRFLDQVGERDAIRTRLTELWDHPRYGIPRQRGGRYFFSKNDGLQNQSVLYWTPELAAEPRVLLDPNLLSPDGTVALSDYAVSRDGRWLAYAISKAGSDWKQWKVREVSTGNDLDDVIDWVKFSGVSWSADGKGFYYGRFDEPTPETELVGTNYFQKLYYHRLGTPQSFDQLVYERPDQKQWQFHGHATEDGKFLVISVHRGTRQDNAVYYKRLDRPDAPVVKLLPDFDARYYYLGNDGSLFWFHTNLDAPRDRVIAIDVERPERENWREIIPQSDELLERVSLIGDQFIAEYLRDAHSAVKVFDLGGRLVREIALAGIGSVHGFGGNRSDRETFYAFTSFTTPSTIYRYDLDSGESTLFRRPEIDVDSARYEIKQIFYTSADGTRVPMFICHKKGLELNGQNPTLLNGYGGFNVSKTPFFSVVNLVWMEMGGVFAMPNLRGGGEYGRPWHEAGTKLQKQNVFDDFLGAAEWLIEHRYTSPQKLAIKGGSNGGLLVGACMTQRPELFGAVLPAVGVMDMLRFHKFTIGWAWISDYGCSDNPEEFAALYAYSPLHCIKPGTPYPPTLVTTADHDDRVVPAHSYKFAAALQAAQAGNNPVLIRIETRAGHGAGKPTAKLIEEAADQLAFLTEELGINLPENFALEPPRQDKQPAAVRE